MRSFMFVLTLVALCSAVQSQEIPQVDQAEVLRRGNLVQVVGDGIRAADADLFAEAIGPPASDADKWFISVLSMKNCPGCVKLQQEWNTNPWLLALATPADAKQSWSHFAVYDKDDQSQTFRFGAIRVTTFPTIIVQPPRSRRFGDPSTVVFQGVFKGDSEKLAREITSAIRSYVQKLQTPATPIRQSFGQVVVGIDPPWRPSPPVQPTPSPVLPLVDPTVPPQPATPTPTPATPTPAPAPQVPWATILSLMTAGFSIPTGAGLLYWGISFVRAQRQAAHKAPLVNQAALDLVLAELKKISGQDKTNVNTPS